MEVMEVIPYGGSVVPYSVPVLEPAQRAQPQTHAFTTTFETQQQQQMYQSSINQSRKRKGGEVSSSEPSSVAISLGQTDFIVMENEKRKHIKVASMQEYSTTSTSSSDTPSKGLTVAQPESTSSSTEESSSRSVQRCMRTVELRFGHLSATFRGKIVAKEPWGTMCELLEDCQSDSGDVIPKSSRFWCKWDGSVNAYSIPVFEVMYPC